MENKQQDETMKERIIGLLRKGYTRKQLINDFGFAERTVDAAIRAYRELNDGNVEGTKEGSKPSADDGASPTVKSKNSDKGGGGPPRDGALAIRKEKESVLPEWLERDVAVIFDGEARDQRLFLAGMSVPLMGLRLFTEAVNPIVDLLTVWQRGQAEAARAAQGSGVEMAREAGEAAATGMAKFLIDTKPWLSAAPDPWKAMIMDTMRPIFQQLVGQLMGSFMRFAPRAQPGVQPPPQGQAVFHSPSMSQPGTVREAPKEEIEEVFND